MPRLLIRDAHEWINEIPTVPSYHLANQLRQGNGLEWLSGERRPCWVWLQSQFVGRHRRCSYRWEACRFWKTTSFIVALQIQWKGKGGYGLRVPHGSLFHSRFVWVPSRVFQRSQFTFFSHKHAFWVCEPSFGNKTEMGSLAGAAYLLNINAGVLRRAQWGQKPHVAHKGKSSLDLRLSVLV